MNYTISLFQFQSNYLCSPTFERRLSNGSLLLSHPNSLSPSRSYTSFLKCTHTHNPKMPKLQRFQRKPHDGGQVKGSINYSNTQGRKDLMTDRIQTQNDEITKTAESFPNGNQTHKDLNSFITCESIIQRDFFILTKLIELMHMPNCKWDCQPLQHRQILVYIPRVEKVRKWACPKNLK